MTKARGLDDESVAAALRAYQAALDAGDEPDRAGILARFPDLSDELAGCLDGLDLLYRVAPHLKDETADESVLRATSLGDFRILREVGRGGMGVVYEAEQMSLGRRVALKVLPFAAVLDSRYLQRFRNEAQAAAHLHHANIVPVHAVGCERGVHYYAMQFIEGATLAALIGELKNLAGNRGQRDSSPALAAIAREGTAESPHYCRAVAELGVQAAAALEYAHESGVVHRDIKPPNLIVDAKGQLWITDFGLASTRNDTGLTMTGDIVGTLRYMSPEQSLGRRKGVDHRTDIYSLAVTLYELVTLRQAFPGDNHRTILREIASKEPIRPRAINPATPPELETVLLKAMAKDPADRYSTAKEFGDDLQRYLEDRPIHARRPSALKRAAKWSRRHPAAVWATAVIVVLALAGLIAGNIAIARQRDDANEARDAATAANRARDARFEEMRGLVDRMLTRVAVELKDRPHMEALRRELLEEALAFYRGYLERKAGDPEARAETARAHARVADICTQLGQRGRAEKAYERAIELGEALVEQFPDIPEYKLLLARVLHDSVRIIWLADRFDEIERRLRRAASLTDELLATSPSQRAYRHIAARVQRAIGALLVELGRPGDAEVAFERARAVWKSLVDQNPNEAELQQGLASVVADLVHRMIATNRFAEAEKMVRGHTSLIERLLSASATPTLRQAHGDSWQMLGLVLEHEERFQEAITAYRKACPIFDALSREFPGVPTFASKSAHVLTRLSAAYGRLGRWKDAVQAGRECVEKLGALVTSYPDLPRYKTDLAAAHGDLGTLYSWAQRPEDAEREYKRAIEIHDALADTLHNAFDRHNRAVAYYNLSQTVRDRVQAERLCRRSIELLRGIVEDHGTVALYRQTLARSLATLGKALRDSAQGFDEGKACFEEAVKIMKALVDAYAENPEYPIDLARYHLWYALLCETQPAEQQTAAREYRNAVRLFPNEVELLNRLAWFLATCSDRDVRNPSEAVEVAERAVEAAPEDAGVRNTLGVALYRNGDWKAAVKALDRSMQLASGGDAYDWLVLAMAYWQLGDKQLARKWCDKAVAWMDENKSDDDELKRLRAEAEKVLGIQKETGD